MKRILIPILILLFTATSATCQKSIALKWNEILLEGIRGDFARPTVHARNLFHASAAMYDAWAVYDTVARPLFLGDTIGDFYFAFEGLTPPSDITAARKEAISYSMYRFLRHRFMTSPGAWNVYTKADSLMQVLGFDPSVVAQNYQSGSPAALGNYIAQQIITFGIQDGANEELDYGNTYYKTANSPLIMDLPGNPGLSDPNKWQPLTLNVFIDQSGNVIPFNTPEFLSPEWGNVQGFALKQADLTIYEVNENEFQVFQDPGPPSYIQDGLGIDDPYKWGFALVAAWSSHLGTTNDTIIDISPGSIGNVDELPDSFEEYREFYQFKEGGDNSNGHEINPSTGASYPANLVKRSDYGRVLAEFWADGPHSETPPGHWFTILNYVNSRPELEKRFEGKGPILSDLEWDIKTYLALGGAMHDCAVSAWGIKGYYDYIRPVSAIRYMAEKGQSTSEVLPNFDPHGFPLIEGYIELVKENDPLAGPNGANVNEIKVLSWKGPNYITNPDNTVADVDWILAKNWWPYQRPSFVTPPFAGYISGHSTFSRAAADMLAKLTGDEFFPGGMGEFSAKKNEFLVFEDGPSEDITLQWATYRDASDQTSLSRIWGGIHPPIDDIPGRKIGITIANECFAKARSYFYQDLDNDGFYSYEDCDDLNATFYPGAVEVCDGLDNNCDGFIDEDLENYTYFRDNDADGFGDANNMLDTCTSEVPFGYSILSTDCNDQVYEINPEVLETCDGIDNNCNGLKDEGLEIFRYFLDQDGDGYGDPDISLDTCIAEPPVNFTSDFTDCNDGEASINPGIKDTPDNLIDEDCSGRDASLFTFIWNDLSDANFVIHYPEAIRSEMKLYDTNGRMVQKQMIDFAPKYVEVEIRNLTTGIYILVLESSENRILYRQKVLIVER